MMSLLAKLTQPKKMVADKDLQGCIIEWDNELAHYHTMTNKRALNEDQQGAPDQHVLACPADARPLPRAH